MLENEIGRSLHRSRMDIMENILSVAMKGARKTHIMYRCNLSFEQLNVYLDFLLSLGLLNSVSIKIEDKSRSEIYETSNKGQAFIQAYRNLTALCAI